MEIPRNPSSSTRSTRKLRNGSSNTSPGTSTSYSGEGYEYLARFAQNKMGHSLPELAEQYVFQPIGMRDTSYTPQPWYARRLAVPQGPKGETEAQSKINWSAADLVRTTIGDYSKFVISVMRDQKLTRAIARERRTMTRNLVKPDDEKRACAEQKSGPCTITAGMGLGWEVETHNDETILDHDGSDWGVRTLTFLVPRRKLGVVIFTNGENGEKVIREIVGIIFPDPVYIATL